MALAFLGPLLGSIASSVISSIFGSAEERAKRKTLKEEQKNLGQKYNIEESKLSQILANRRLNIIHAIVILVGGIVFPMAIYDAASGTEYVHFVFDAIRSRIPEEYIIGYLSLIAAIFGVRSLRKK